jgi:hypothetical protein
LALPLYALTLFVSAFILFLVQPIIGKILLPKLGGTPQVWNTCMVFFQMVLLAGYAYTHNVSTRLTLRQQLMAHGVLLLLPLIVLLPIPFALGIVDPSNSIWTFVPDLGSNPIPSTLGILFTYVALPFLVVATSAPLLQKWFVHTGHPASKDPYFLYGASNLGSMLSLIVYPALIEPYVSLRNQGWVYTYGYLALAVFVLACAAMVWNSREIAKPKLPEPKPEPKPEPAPATMTAPPATQTAITTANPAATGVKSGQPGKPHGKGPAPKSIALEPAHTHASDDITFGRRLRWVMLAAIPSSLMLGITTHITTDLSPIPLFWLVPLILYLLSFILVFARWPVVWTDKPHTFFLYVQPFCVWAMIMADVFNLTSSPAFIGMAIGAHVLGFFATTMVCHGELAKDRPSTKHLTEFYLWMSVGGMLGGMFNALISPIVFKKLWEFPLAIFAAGLVRPKMFETGLLDNFLAGIFEGQAETPTAKTGAKGPRAAVSHGGAHASESLVTTLDFAWPVVILFLVLGAYFIPFGNPNTQTETGRSFMLLVIFGVPLLVACALLTRPLRIGLGIGVVLLAHNFYLAQGDTSKFTSRSYFGAMSVKEFTMGREGIDLSYRQLIHGHIDHGMNFLIPGDKRDRGHPNKDLSRLATTYYHREGPVGRVMEKFNWFPDPPNSNKYTADARMPASLVGSAIAQIGVGGLPTTTFETLWSEPPIATVGLGTGTMASYGRAYQHVHFYEIDNQVLRMSLHTAKTREIKDAKQYDSEIRANSKRDTWFNYLEQAIDRGCTVQVLMGDARLRMALPYQNHYLDETDRGGGPNNFYHMMVVDAFSSDAIPAHLLTEEAFKVYFEKLTDEGVLCVHTSNRFVDLPKVVGAIAAKMEYEYIDEDGKKKKSNYYCRRGHDNNTDRKQGHYTSEWVMVAKKPAYLFREGGDAEFINRYREDWGARQENKNRVFEEFWTPVPVNDRYRWTDDYYNLLSVIRW